VGYNDRSRAAAPGRSAAAQQRRSRGCLRVAPNVKIRLNGDPFEVAGPLTVSLLLARLDVDARRVAVEHNLVVLKRASFDTIEIREGDQVEIVNFVGGG
jgi:sulfur carrier protein